MAARKNTTNLTPEWRARIQTSMLINRLNKIANGEADCTPAQIRALEIALKKTLPDLSAQVGADGGAPELNLNVITGVPRADR